MEENEITYNLVGVIHNPNGTMDMVLEGSNGKEYVCRNAYPVRISDDRPTIPPNEDGSYTIKFSGDTSNSEQVNDTIQKFKDEYLNQWKDDSDKVFNEKN